MATIAENFLALIEFNTKKPIYPSKWVERKELEKINAVGNGSSLFTRGSLFNKYEFEIIRKNNSPTGAILKARIVGEKKIKNVFHQTIPTQVKEYYKNSKCLILGTGSIEIDHKDGRKRITVYDIKDFQPLSKAANDAKRQHCRVCKETGERFDGKNLGFPMSYTYGSKKYENTCKGCYWHDIKDWMSHLSYKI